MINLPLEIGETIEVKDLHTNLSRDTRPKFQNFHQAFAQRAKNVKANRGIQELTLVASYLG